MNFQTYSSIANAPAPVQEFLSANTPGMPGRRAYHVLYDGDGTLNHYTEELEGQTPIGFLVLATYNWNRYAHIYIDPAFRRQGFGRRLLRWTLEQHGTATGEVPPEALAFAQQYGERNGLIWEFNVLTYPHVGCRCNTCVHEMELFDNRHR